MREAEANAAQIEARLGITAEAPFNANAVPEVQNAKASFDLAQSEFDRIRSLLDQKVVSQSEFEQRRTQLEAMRQQYEAAKNGAAQQFQSLQAARARVALARKALADTVVRAPFAGLVAERLVSVGDYVTRGMKVAVVVRVNPLRAELTVPEQFISADRHRTADHLRGRRLPESPVHREDPVRLPGVENRTAGADGRGHGAQSRAAS